MSASTRAAALSGVLLTLAAPPSPAWPLVLGALAPWAAAVARLPSDAGPGAARSGAVLFAVHWGLLLVWMLRLAPRVGAWTVPAWAAQVATLSLIGAGVGWLVHRLGTRWPLPVALGVAWVAGEWVRGSALGPFDFPWMGVAVPLTAHPPLIQPAAWVGERGLALGVGAVNGALALALARAGEGGGRWRAAAWAVAGVTAIALLGHLRIARLAPEARLRALVVQPAVPLEVKRGPELLAVAASLGAIEAALPEGPPAEVDVVVLPESAVPAPLDGPEAGPLRERVASWSDRLGRPVLIGAFGWTPEGRTNAVFVASSDAGADWPRADKVRLVPGVEWAPGDPEGLVAAPAPRTLDLPGVATVGVLVCIESAGPEPARALRAAGADVLVNVTNDAWLAEGPRRTRTAAFHQHPAHLRLRAVETGAGALRVGNNGRSTVVDPAGRERLLLPPHRPGTARAEVPSLRAPTPFARTGDWVGPLAALAALAGALVRRRAVGPSARGPG